MIRLAAAALTLIFAAQAHASFGYTACSSPDGTVSYKYSFIWSNPKTTDLWTINGQSYEASSQYDENDVETPPEVVAEAVSERQTLSSESNPMTGSSTYTYKVKLTYQKAGSPSASTEAWVICSSAGGI